MNPSTCISCIILSAGSSGRMGRHKALLPFGDQKICFLEKLIHAYTESGIDKIVVVVNEELQGLINEHNLKLPDNVLVVVNLHPELGRFHSLKTGLKYITKESFVFIQNADNPFIDSAILGKMIDARDQAGTVVPVSCGKAGHPVLIPPDVCESITRSESLETRIDSFLKDFPSSKIEVNDPGILVNINTQEDYRKVFDTVNTEKGHIANPSLNKGCYGL